jgi:hypothetical protein
MLVGATPLTGEVNFGLSVFAPLPAMIPNFSLSAARSYVLLLLLWMVFYD